MPGMKLRVVWVAWVLVPLQWPLLKKGPVQTGILWEKVLAISEEVSDRLRCSEFSAYLAVPVFYAVVQAAVAAPVSVAVPAVYLFAVVP